MIIKKRALIFVWFSVVLFFVSCDMFGPKEPKEPSHVHSYELTDDGYLDCSCGQSVISDPFIAEISGKNVLSYRYLSIGTFSSFGLTVNGDEIIYQNTSSAKDIVIRTTSNQSLVVDAPEDNVTHFGSAYKVTIKRVANNSFYEKANINGYLVVKQGHVQFETAVPEVVVETSSQEPVKLSLNSGITIEKIQVNESSNNNIKISGASDSKVKKIATKAPLSVAIDTEVIEVESDNVSISASGDAHIYEISIDESMHFDSINALSITIADDAVVDGLFGVSSEGVKIHQETMEKPHIHTWGVGIVTKEASPESEGEKTYICDICSQEKVETISKVDAGAHGFVVTEEPDKKIHANLSVSSVAGKENTVIVSLTSTSANTDYTSSVYKWYVDYANLVQTDNGKKKSTFEYYIPDGGIHTISCSYSNAYGGGSTSVQVNR